MLNLLLIAPLLAHADEACNPVSLVEKHCVCEEYQGGFTPYLEALTSAGTLNKNRLIADGQFFYTEDNCKAMLAQSPFCKE